MPTHRIALKSCSQCGVTKPVSDFGVETRRSDGLRCRCKACENAYVRKFRASNPSARNWWKKNSRQVKLKAKYGISLAEYEVLHTAQAGRCAICRTNVPGGKYNRLHVDHNHDTGAIRGLLCNRCNAGIGLLGDTYEAIMRAATYLRGSSDHTKEASCG